MNSKFLTAIGLLALAGGCSYDTLTAEEMSVLQTMRLPRTVAPSPTNAFADNPEAAKLGRQFFFDRRFSGPLVEGSDPNNGGLGTTGQAGMVACATCHDPGKGGADPRAGSSTSLAAGWTGRNTPTVINAAHSRWMFWDGRKDSMWSQALAPMESAVEHNFSRVAAARVIWTHYRDGYEKVFGAPLPPMDDARRFPLEGRPGTAGFDTMSVDDKLAVNRVFANFGKALEAYERTLVDRSSAFDRFLDGDHLALTPGAVRGAKLFVGRAACNECHSGPMLADNRFHNHGVPQLGAKIPAVDRGRHDGIAKVLSDEFNSVGAFSDMTKGDMLTNLAPASRDLGAFKTPTLRNVTRTGPYMHTGAFSSLWDIVDWYNEAAGTDGFSGKREPASEVPLHLSEQDINDLVEFMRALDGDPMPDEVTTAPVLP